MPNTAEIPETIYIRNTFASYFVPIVAGFILYNVGVAAWIVAVAALVLILFNGIFYLLPVLRDVFSSKHDVINNVLSHASTTSVGRSSIALAPAKGEEYAGFFNSKLFYNPLQSTTQPSSKYNTPLFKAPHNPLQSTTQPSSKCLTKLFYFYPKIKLLQFYLHIIPMVNYTRFINV